MDRQLLSRKILREIREYLFRQRIEAPAYDTYRKAITAALLGASRRINQSLATHLTVTHQQTLDAFLEKTFSPHRADLVFYKHINQFLQPKAIKASLEAFKTLKARLETLNGLVGSLRLSDATIDYHAYWTGIADADKIHDHYRKYLFLLCFLIRQVRLRQDFLLDIILQTVKAAGNSTKRLQKEDYFQNHRLRRKATQLLVESRLNYRQQLQAVKAIMGSPWSDREKVVAIESLLETEMDLPAAQEEQVRTLAGELNRDEQSAFYRLWEKRSAWLSNRIGHCLAHLCINVENTDASLLAALSHYSRKNGKVTAPARDLTWLDDAQQDLLYRMDEQTGKLRFNHRLYRMFLFAAPSEGIKSGTVNFDHSYRYQFLEEYLLAKSSGNKTGRNSSVTPKWITSPRVDPCWSS